MIRVKKRFKKKNIKTKVILISILIIILIFVVLINNSAYFKGNKNKKENDDINISLVMDNIISNDVSPDITIDFLKWIYKYYEKDVLINIEKSLKDLTYSNSLWHSLTGNSLKVLLDKYNNVYDDAKNISIINAKNKDISVINFIGDVSLADNWYIMKEYDKRNQGVLGILDQKIIDTFNSDDITVANNEFTISNRGSELANKYYTFRASPSRLSIYKDMNVDLVTLANNHVYDYGEDAFYDTLISLNEYNIPYIGAGNNIDEAKMPYYFIVNGYKIAFVNATRAEKYILTPEATVTSGGVFRCYDPSTLIEVIKETSNNSDYTIALLHWGKEDSTVLENVQVDTAKEYIDAGADIIIGSHAHTLQGIDFYNDKAIVYNLGDFIFNHEDKDTAIFQLTITDDGSFKYKIIPCHQKNKYTSMLESDEALRVINTLRNLSSNVIINDNGEFTSK